MKIVLIFLTVIVGMMIPVQAGINAEFRRHVGHALWAGTLNFSVGLIAILILCTLFGLPLPSFTNLSTAPWWSWLGGLCGASLVVIAIIAAPPLGASLFIVCLLSGQLTSSVIIDHFGWVGYDLRPITSIRVLGLVLFVVGIFLVERGS